KLPYQQEISCVAVSPNTGQIAVGYISGDVKIWDPHFPEIPITGHRHTVHRLLFIHDGSLLAAASKFWTYSVSELKPSASPNEKPETRRLYRRPGNLDWVWEAMIKARMTRLVNDFAFISKDDSTLLMVAREDGQLEVREAISGKKVLTTPLFATQLLQLGPAQRKKEEDERRERAKSGSVNKPEDVLLNIATSPDGNWLATAGKDGNIYLWNIKD